MTDAAPSREQVLAVLLKEYERVCTDIRAVESQNDKIVGFGITIIGAGAAYGVSQKVNEVFLVLPFMFIAVFLYAVLQYHNIFWYGGYKKALEERINVFVGGTVLAWESIVDELRHRVHVANLPLITIYVILLILASSYSNFRVYTQYGIPAGAVQAVFIMAFLVALLLAVRRAMRAFQEAYSASITKLTMSVDEET